jgi:hypothetical protein
MKKLAPVAIKHQILSLVLYIADFFSSILVYFRLIIYSLVGKLHCQKNNTTVSSIIHQSTKSQTLLYVIWHHDMISMDVEVITGPMVQVAVLTVHIFYTKTMCNCSQFDHYFSSASLSL